MNATKQEALSLLGKWKDESTVLICFAKVPPVRVGLERVMVPMASRFVQSREIKYLLPFLYLPFLFLEIRAWSLQNEKLLTPDYQSS